MGGSRCACSRGWVEFRGRFTDRRDALGFVGDLAVEYGASGPNPVAQPAATGGRRAT